MDANKISILSLLDHSKAFDSIDHSILCNKLKKIYKFSTSALNLINSYLVGRFQAVSINGNSSRLLPLLKGVPQGSILGPLLFSIYINDLPFVLRYCKINMYADDVELYTSCSLYYINDGISNMNSDLKKVWQWAAGNGLSLNPSKSKCILITRHKLDHIHMYPLS